VRVRVFSFRVRIFFLYLFFRFNETGSVWSGSIGLSFFKPEPNRTDQFFLFFNRFIRFFFSSVFSVNFFSVFSV
jgi:hypothetical protein